MLSSRFLDLGLVRPVSSHAGIGDGDRNGDNTEDRETAARIKELLKGFDALQAPGGTQ